MVTFANVLGFLALLGIPLILMIHFLQRQSQRQVVSTLFLLETLDRENVQGRRFDRLQNSLPLWLQLLLVLLLTWILVQPRWSRQNSVQKIAIVIDSSASMRAYQEELREAIATEIPQLGQGAETMELIALDSHIDAEPIYNGTEVADLITELEEQWQPYRPAHDPGPVLRVGRSLVGGGGIVLYITDQPQTDVGYDARVLAMGEPADNVGFAGLQVDTSTTPASWRAVVRNYAASAQERSWHLQIGQQRTEPRSITLQPGENRTLSGRFPEAGDRITLQLSGDAFDQDDTAPLTVALPKPLAVATNPVPDLENLMQGILQSIEHTVLPSEETPVDLVLSSYDSLDPRPLEPVSVVLLAQAQPGRRFLSGPIVAANHPLVDGLNWQGLIARTGPGIPAAEVDEVLLWQGSRPLIILRQASDRRQLLVNFDVPTSNAATLPAFIVLVHRFVEMIRADKPAPEQSNFELNQPLSLSIDRGEDAAPVTIRDQSGTQTIALRQAASLRAPAEPGFFEIRQGSVSLLRGACHFADTREADLSKAGSDNSQLVGLKLSTLTEHQKEDDVWQVWLLLGLAALLLCWYWIGRKADRRAMSTSTSAPAPT